VPIARRQPLHREHPAAFHQRLAQFQVQAQHQQQQHQQQQHQQQQQKPSYLQLKALEKQPYPPWDCHLPRRRLQVHTSRVFCVTILKQLTRLLI
jgi:hypothetical protein